jgi:apolipoprotein N-acyltransferase
VSAPVVLINVLLAQLVLRWRSGASVGLGTWIVAAVLGLTLGAQGLRMLEIERSLKAASQVSVGVVQPNFGVMSLVERERNGILYVRELRGATQRLAVAGAELIVWPETGWPFLWDRDMDTLYPQGHPWAIFGEHRAALVMGTLSHDFGSSAIFNSPAPGAPACAKTRVASSCMSCIRPSSASWC